MARTRQFDEDALTAAALELFWTHGYDSTSIESIASATGVGNGSIYAAYGSKRGLFETVFTEYCASRVNIVRDAMGRDESLEASVRRFFAVIVADCATQPDRRGCLMLNTISEWGDRDAAILALCQRTTRDMEGAIADRILVASPDRADVAILAAQIILVSQGIIALSRLKTANERLLAIAESYCGTLALA
jgi:AcrR family transcriptional regulator